MISWNKVTKPKEEGGLGLQVAKPKNLSLLAKLNWRFNMEKDKDCVKVLHLKCSNPRRIGSNVWARLKHGNSILRQGIKQKLGANSTLNYWYDKWLTGGTIKGLIEGPLRRNEELLTMNDMRVGGRWDFI